MDDSVYHVLLEDRTVGPYNRRTIVGMRVKKTLTSDHVLVGTDGKKMSVGDFIRRRLAAPFTPERSGSYSVVQGVYAAWLIQVSGREIGMPRFRGEMEVRVQADGMLRMAGRYRRGFGWKHGRVKVPLKEVAHAQVRGSQVELALRANNERKAGQFTLELFTPETAAEFLGWLPNATPFPRSDPAGPAARSATASRQAVWMAAISVISVAMVVGVVLLVVLYRGGR